MEGSKYNKLLYPTDFSDQSVHFLGKLLQRQEFKETDIYVLHAFRLIGGNAKDTNLLAAKRMLEQNSVKAFDQLNHKVFDHVDNPHHFLSDVGFLSDRIKSNITNHKIDLLVLCDDIRKKMMVNEGETSNHFINTISCDVMLLPEGQIITPDQ